MRAVEGNLGHSLQYDSVGEEWSEKKEKKGGLAIPCAHATRGLRRPSLDARTTGKRQASLPNSTEGWKLYFVDIRI